MNSETLASIIESIVFVSGNAIAVKDIAEKLEVTNAKVLEAAKKLQEKYNEESGLNLLIFNNKLQFCSNPKNAENVAMVLNPIRERELSKSMLEVAAIIAYKQPVTRLDLEEIRGVDSEYAIQNLLKLNVIEIVGRKEAPGRPVIFGTTDGFLKRFQISSLDELPDYEQLLASIRGTNEKSSYPNAEPNASAFAKRRRLSVANVRLPKLLPDAKPRMPLHVKLLPSANSR